MSARVRCASTATLALTSILAFAAPAATRAGDPGDALGTYRLEGRARLHARPFPAREEVVHADAILAPGAAPGKVRLRVAIVGGTCELDARVDAAGKLTIPAGQRCPIALDDETTEGAAEARVVAGSGRVRDDVLELELTAAVAGTVRFRTTGALGSIGEALSLPGLSERPVAFEGEVEARAAGRRDRSRAAR